MAVTLTTHLLLESRRRVYLSALGIPVYHPRKHLPGALPSPLLAGVKPVQANSAQIIAEPPAQAAVSASMQVPVQTVSVRPAPAQTASVHAALAQLQMTATPTNDKTAIQTENQAEERKGAAVAPRAEAAGPRDAEKEGQQTEETPAFAFAFVPVNEQLAVINELPWAGAAMLAPGSRQLLAGILKALTLPSEERHLSSLNFVWPPPDMPAAAQGPVPARELLKGFLAQRFRIRPVRYLLVLAEQGAPYLFPDGFKLQEGGVFRHPDFDVDVLVTRSLGAMEAVPALKRDVWTALQPLLGALKGGSVTSSAVGPAGQRQDP